MRMCIGLEYIFVLLSKDGSWRYSCSKRVADVCQWRMKEACQTKAVLPEAWVRHKLDTCAVARDDDCTVMHI